MKSYHIIDYLTQKSLVSWFSNILAKGAELSDQKELSYDFSGTSFVTAWRSILQ